MVCIRTDTRLGQPLMSCINGCQKGGQLGASCEGDVAREIKREKKERRATIKAMKRGGKPEEKNKREGREF